MPKLDAAGGDDALLPTIGWASAIDLSSTSVQRFWGEQKHG
ncbi:hypothetical protein [Pseudaminobacter soli (ex Li et al. 2025)]|nr:hypothetical protein [Mesorhizobium soli]